MVWWWNRKRLVVWNIARRLRLFAMLVNFVVSITISKFTPAPDDGIQKLIEDIRNPDEE